MAPSPFSNFGTVVPDKSELIPEINFPLSSGEFAIFGRAGDVAAVSESSLYLPIAGTWTFCLDSDNGSRLIIHGTLLIEIPRYAEYIADTEMLLVPVTFEF
jgi:hypothetical protein